MTYSQKILEFRVL